jgi:hypothetical protein
LKDLTPGSTQDEVVLSDDTATLRDGMNDPWTVDLEPPVEDTGTLAEILLKWHLIYSLH